VFYRVSYNNQNFAHKEFPCVFHDVELSQSAAVANWHSGLEILCCCEGTGEIHLDSHTYPFTAGDIYIANPNVLHSIKSTGQIRYYCIIADTAFLKQAGLFADGRLLSHYVRSDAAAAQIAELFRLRAEDAPPYRLVQKTLEIVIGLYENYGVTAGGDGADVPFRSQRIKEVVRFLMNHPEEKMTLDGNAAATRVSKCYLAREFKKYTGHTVIEYRNILRCEQARQMILAGASVQHAQLSVGFEDASYFAKCYKRVFGIPPSGTKEEWGRAEGPI